VIRWRRKRAYGGWVTPLTADVELVQLSDGLYATGRTLPEAEANLAEAMEHGPMPPLSFAFSEFPIKRRRWWMFWRRG
jgi:hypothetical protein